jgi:Domain of unknown function (DUF5615)
MLLYADEDFAFPVTVELRRLGHDVVTAQDDGRRATPDLEILARAHSLGRVVLTHNRGDFKHLHEQGADHSGIVSATQDTDFDALAQRINNSLPGLAPGRWHVRVNKCP